MGGSNVRRVLALFWNGRPFQETNKTSRTLEPPTYCWPNIGPNFGCSMAAFGRLRAFDGRGPGTAEPGGGAPPPQPPARPQRTPKCPEKVGQDAWSVAVLSTGTQPGVAAPLLPRHAQHQAARLSLRATGSRPSTEHQALAPTLNSEKFFRTQVALTATNCFSPALEGTRSACQHTPGVRGHDTPADPYKAQVTPRRGTGRSESSGHFAGRHVRLPRLFQHMLFATFFSHISFSCLPASFPLPFRHTPHATPPGHASTPAVF